MFVKRRRFFSHSRLLYALYGGVVILIGYNFSLHFGNSKIDGFFTLIPLSDSFLFNISLSPDLFCFLNETLIEETYSNYRRHSYVTAPYRPQLLPLAYAIRVDSQLYWIKYNLILSIKPTSILLYENDTNPFIEYAQETDLQPKLLGSLLPIPHGQMFRYKDEQRFTVSIRQNNITDLYIARLKDHTILRLRYEPLGIDQLEHQRWVFFFDERIHKLLAVTNLQPHVIVSVNDRTGTVKEYARTSQPQLFASLKGEQIFMGSAPIRLPKKNLYLAVFHTSSQTNLFYVFEDVHPYEIKCIGLQPLLGRKLSRHPITEIQLINESILTSQSGIIILSTILTDSRMQCAEKSKLQQSFALQWLPSFIPSIEDTPDIFNPAILPLPEGSLYPYLAAGRAGSNFNRHRIIYPAYNRRFTPKFWSMLLICLMDHHFSCVHTPHVLHLYFPIEGIVQRFGIAPSIPYNYVGPEDPRLVWTETSAPLLMYDSNALERLNNSVPVRLVWIIDVRHVFKQLRIILPKHYSQVPFYTIEQGVELNYGSQVWEKNWMIFIYQSRMLIGYSPEPKITIKRKLNPLENDTRRWFYEDTGISHQKLKLLYPEKVYEKIFQTKKNNISVSIEPIHQGPNALLIVTKNSTFYITILHQRVFLHKRHNSGAGGMRRIHYMHFTTIFESKAPYRWLAVSRQHIDSILSEQSHVTALQRQFIFVTTIAFADQIDIANGYGTLDSRVLISYGLSDQCSYAWIGGVSRLLRSMRALQ